MINHCGCLLSHGCSMMNPINWRNRILSLKHGWKLSVLQLDFGLLCYWNGQQTLHVKLYSSTVLPAVSGLAARRLFTGCRCALLCWAIPQIPEEPHTSQNNNNPEYPELAEHFKSGLHPICCIPTPSLKTGYQIFRPSLKDKKENTPLLSSVRWLTKQTRSRELLNVCCCVLTVGSVKLS